MSDAPIRSSGTASVRVGVLTGRVDAAPGEIAAAQVALHNDGSVAATVRIRVVGLDAAAGAHDDIVVAVPAGADTTCFVPVPVPAGLGIGDHAAGLEVHTDRPGDRPCLATFTVSVGSVERVELTPVPATVRGLRRAKLRVDVANFEAVPVELDLRGESPDATVQFKRPHVRVLPGQRTLVGGRVKGPRRWAGEPTQHTLVITGQGRASATSATAVFVQRPLFARKLRGGLAALLVIAIWLAAVGGFIWWWRDRGNEAQLADGSFQTFDTDGDGVPDLYVTSDGQRITAVDTDGDGVPDLFTTADGQQLTGVDTDADGEPDAFTDAAGNPVADPRSGQPPSGEIAAGEGDGDDADNGPRAPTSAVVRGTVQAAGAIDDISISLTPISLAGAPATPAALTASGPGESLGTPDPSASGGGSGDGPITKLWPARLGVASAVDALDGRRQSEPLRPLPSLAGQPATTAPQPNGVWLFTNVALRQSYELTFAKPGFNTQSFVVTPPDDGSATEIDVELEPATGSIAGRVTGPGGPLGGVEITVTDGTLLFTTTTATVGDVGTWSVQEVSTPGVYTVTAERRGFGTEVRQVALTAGQQFTGADLAMKAGVGSIGGRVLGPDGAPLGGATITATTDDATYTTSSHTDGDIGSYHLPQLDVPATYTVTVSLDGYLTQTRRVGVSAAVGGVDFTLTRTTLRLTGMVTSQGDGKGIPNAGLTLSTGDLKFRVSTAGGDNSGTFAIEDLPPGIYTVEVEHYQHDTSTQMVTLTAGVTPPPLEISLRPNGGIAGIGTGSLVVEVVDPTGQTSAQREIKNATVRLLSTQSGQVVRELTQEAFDFELTDIQVGTYTVQVTAPRYNPAPPRRVSIGLSQTRVTVELARLGQASGRIVDSLTDTVLNDYFVSLYRQPESPGDAPIFTLPSRADGSWQTPPDSLIPGTYRVEVTDNASPKGYLVRTDQLLDAAVVGATPADRFMKFVLPGDATDPVVVADIEADRYPVLSGRVYEPVLDGTATRLDPIDSSGLSVTITCSDATAPFTAASRDAHGGPGNDSFSVTPEDVDAQNLTGSCQVTAQHPGRVPATVTLTAVDASNGTTTSDREVQLVLVPPAPSIGGSVFWMDGATRNPLPGVDVTARPITQFPSQEAGAAPAPRLDNLATTTNGSGNWDLDGQLFGVTDYTFSEPGFTPQPVAVTVDDTGAHVTPSATVTETPTGRFDVQLVPTSDRELAGTLTIHTTASPVDFSAFTLTAQAPGGQTVTEGACTGTAIDRSVDNAGTPTVLEFRICNATAGRWGVTVNRPAGFEYFGTPPPVELPVPPVGATPAFPLQLVEFARIELTLLDSTGAELDVTPDVTLSDATTSITSLTPDPTEDHRFSIENIPVAPTDPASTPREYTLQLELDGYDVNRATVNGAPVTGGVTALPVVLQAGTTAQFTIGLPALGSVAGTISGVARYADDPQPLDDLPISSLQLTAEPVDADGNARTLAPGEAAPVISQFGLPNGFRLTATPGYYRIVAEHPNYFAQDDPAHPNQVPLDSVPGASSEIGVFLVANDVFERPLGQWELAKRTGVIDLRAVAELGGPAVIGASYTLYREVAGVRVAMAALADDDLAPDGLAVIDDLLPGTYELEVRQYEVPGNSSTPQIAFPAILTVVIGESTSTQVSTATIVAPLPPVAPTITGTIEGINRLDAPVPLPTDPSAYVLTLTYPIPESLVTTDGSTSEVTIPADALLDDDCVLGTDGTGAPQAVCTADIVTTAAGTGRVDYSFQGVPAGAHSLAFNTAVLVGAGFTVPDPMPATIVVADPSTTAGPTFVFEAPDVAVNVKVVADGELLEIVDTGASTTDGVLVDGSPVTTYTQNDTTIELGLLPPRVEPYTIAVTAALHSGTLAPITVGATPGPSPTINETRLLSAALARITGPVQQCSAQGSCGVLASGGLVELLQTEDAATAYRSVSGAIGTYSFDVSAGNYWIRVSQAGYATETVAVNPAAAAGRVATQGPISVDRLASVTVTVANGASLTNPEIQLRVHGGTDVFAPATGPSGSPPQAAFVVPPGDYDVVVGADNYPQVVIDVPNAALGIGTSATWEINLSRRIHLNAVNTGATTVTVRLFQAADDVTSATPIGTSAHSGATPFDFTVDPTAAWFASALKAQVSAAGFRTRVIDLPFALDYVAAPDPTPNVTLHPNVTAVGSIGSTVSNALEAGGTLTATSSVGSASGSVTADGYSIGGLTNAANGTQVEWTIAYEKLGVGTGSAPVAVGATSNGAFPTITVNPRPVTVQFQVNGSGGTGVGGASVTFAGETKLTNNVAPAPDSDDPPIGWVSFTAPESAASTYTASVGSSFASGSVAGFPNVTTPLPVQVVTLTDRTVTVLVQTDTDPGPGTTLAGQPATLSYCTRSGSTNNCVNGTTVTIAATATTPTGTHTFVPTLTPGEYLLIAETASPTRSARTVMSIPATGARVASLASTTLTTT